MWTWLEDTRGINTFYFHGRQHEEHGAQFRRRRRRHGRSQGGGHATVVRAEDDVKNHGRKRSQRPTDRLTDDRRQDRHQLHRRTVGGIGTADFLILWRAPPPCGCVYYRCRPNGRAVDEHRPGVPYAPGDDELRVRWRRWPPITGGTAAERTAPTVTAVIRVRVYACVPCASRLRGRYALL